MCIAHGADASFVGLHLSDVLKRTRNTDVDGAELNRRFVMTAEQGGGWCHYAWRNSPAASVRLKGAHIVPLEPRWGMKCYAGVGYSLVPPPPDEPSSGLYGFVCDNDGRLLAHGASPRFVGKTLAQVIASTENHQLDSASLLRHFRAAARLGGGWVTCTCPSIELSAFAPTLRLMLTPLCRSSAAQTRGETTVRRRSAIR